MVIGNAALKLLGFGSKLNKSGNRRGMSAGSKKTQFKKGAGLKKTGIGTGILGIIGLPIIGGAMSLVGGAASLTGGVLTAASTVAGIASDASTGVMGAAGGMTGAGQSGNSAAASSSQMPMIQSALNGGGSSASGKDGSDFQGPMSMLPTGNEDPMGMMSGMLYQIAVNTSFLGGIDSKLNTLISVMSVPLIEQAKETKGGGNDSDSGPGFVKRTFNSLGDRLSSLSNSLGGAGKSILKGVALGGAFLLFKKFQPQIEGMLASLFETLEGWYSSMNQGGNPVDDIAAYFNNMIENTILPVLTDMATKAMDVIFRALKIALNEFLPDIFAFDIQQASSGATADESSPDQLTVQSYINSGQSLGSITGQGIPGKNLYFDDGLLGKFTGIGATGDFEPGSEERATIMRAARDRLQFMYEKFQQSGGRIRWTNIGGGFELGKGIDALKGTYPIEKIFESQPIIDSKISPMSALNVPLRTNFLKNKSLNDDYIQNLISATYFKRNSLLPKNAQVYGGETGLFRDGNIMNPAGLVDIDPEKALLRLEKIIKQNDLLLKENVNASGDGASLGVDASTTTYASSEHVVSGLTPVYHSDLNMSAFMNNNSIA